jgi:hypothetical protein
MLKHTRGMHLRYPYCKWGLVKPTVKSRDIIHTAKIKVKCRIKNDAANDMWRHTHKHTV